MRKLPSGWYLLAWVVVGLMNLFSGFVSNRVDLIVLGSGLAFAATSLYLTSYVKSEHRVKKALEVIFGLLAIGVAVYGLIATRNLVLGFITLGFVAILPIIAYLATHSLPQISKKSKVRFHCSECGTHFEVSTLRLLLARRFSGYTTPYGLPFPRPDPTIILKTAYCLKCPKCGKKSWLTPYQQKKILF